MRTCTKNQSNDSCNRRVRIISGRTEINGKGEEEREGKVKGRPPHDIIIGFLKNSIYQDPKYKIKDSSGFSYNNMSTILKPLQRRREKEREREPWSIGPRL